MSTQTQNLRGPSSIVGTVRARLDKTKIGGRPPTYYLSGWRLGVFFLVLAILFPLLGWQFPRAQFSTMLEHLRISAQSAYVIAGEILGAAILLRDRRRRRQSS